MSLRSTSQWIPTTTLWTGQDIPMVNASKRGSQWLNITPQLLILQSGKAEFATYRDRFSANPSGKASKLLDCNFEDKRGHSIFHSWMEPCAVEHILDKVAKQIDVIKISRIPAPNRCTCEAKARILVTIHCATGWHLLRVGYTILPSETGH